MLEATTDSEQDLKLVADRMPGSSYAYRLLGFDCSSLKELQPGFPEHWCSQFDFRTFRQGAEATGVDS